MRRFLSKLSCNFSWANYAETLFLNFSKQILIMVTLDPMGTKFQRANRRNRIQKFSNFYPDFFPNGPQNCEYVLGSIGNFTTNFVVVDRNSHKVALRIPILVGISQVAKSPFGAFAICIRQIYFVVWPTASDAFCLCSYILRPWTYNSQNTWIRLMASRPCCPYYMSVVSSTCQSLRWNAKAESCPEVNIIFVVSVSDPTNISCAGVSRSPCGRSDMVRLVSISTILSDDHCTFVI